MKGMNNGPDRQVLIDRMVEIVQHDAPWFAAVYPQLFYLHHQWYENVELNPMAHNVLKYRRINSERRAQSIAEMNQAKTQFLLWSLMALAVVLVASFFIHRRREQASAL